MKALVLSSGASHGAFQAGVLKALDEMQWKPDIILGASVGAINGSAYAAGMGGQELSRLWLDLSSKDVYKLRPLKAWLGIRQWSSLLCTQPLQKFLEKNLNLEALYESDTIFVASALDVLSGRQHLFSNRMALGLPPYYQVAPVSHRGIMASSAIPGVFPAIDGMWDGAFQQHNPLKPAVLLGATEIVVCHMNVAGSSDLPKGLLQTAMKIANLSSSNHVVSDVKLLKARNADPNYRKIDVMELCPAQPLSYSRLNFDSYEGKRQAIALGYVKAMNAFLKRGKNG